MPSNAKKRIDISVSIKEEHLFSQTSSKTTTYLHLATYENDPKILDEILNKKIH